jgi:RimJ/RimL family protein N-acetyltransferase
LTNVSAASAPQIETARLLMRVQRAEDFPRFAELLADEAAARHIGGVLSRAAAWRRFLQMPGAWLVQGFAMFSVVEKASGRWVGMTGPWYPEGWPGTEVGWTFHPDAWGQGYAREAATAAIDWAFSELGWSEVIHSIDAGNTASIRLAERLGSVYRGPGQLPDPFADAKVGIWAQSREQWRERRRVAQEHSA